MDDNYKIVDSFECCIRNPQLKDQWVIDNILQVVTNSICEGNRVESYDEMLELFWNFWMKYRDNSICIMDVGCPVESHLFRVCIEKDLDTRQWKGPYPAHEVATMLLAKKEDPDVDRVAFIENQLSIFRFLLGVSSDAPIGNKELQLEAFVQTTDMFNHHKSQKHNPLSDAYVSCLCFCFAKNIL